jgi:hypothetical protein
MHSFYLRVLFDMLSCFPRAFRVEGGSLERGEDPLGGVGPSSKAESYSRGARPSREPDVRPGGVRPSSEAEVRSRVAGEVVWWAAEAVGPQHVVGFGSLQML